MPETRPNNIEESLEVEQSSSDSLKQAEMKLSESKSVESDMDLEKYIPLSAVSEQLGKNRETIGGLAATLATENPEWIKVYSSGGPATENYSPELVAKMKEVVERESIPDGWKNAGQIANDLKKDRQTIIHFAEKHREPHPDWFKRPISLKGEVGKGVHEHFSPELIGLLKDELLKYESAPEGWNPIRATAELLGVSRSVIKNMADAFRETNPDWFKIYVAKRGPTVEHYSPELIETLRTKLIEREQAPEGWLTNHSLAAEVGKSFTFVQRAVKPYRKEHPEWFKFYYNDRNTLFEHYSPELIEIVKKNLEVLSTPPKGWKNIYSLEQEVGISYMTIKKMGDSYRSSHPDWFKSYENEYGRELEYYAPELIEVINAKATSIRERSESKREATELNASFINFVKEIADGSSGEGVEFRNLLSIFGGSTVVDILYKFHPDYKKIPVGYVKSILSDYLGEFLSVNPAPINLDSITEKGLELLNEEVFRDSLTIIIKNDVLHHYNSQRKENVNTSPQEAVIEYLERLRTSFAKHSSIELESNFSNVELYYRSIFEEQKKPDKLVDSIESGRLFPEFYQQINIQEIANQKKVLLADEMGVGKSASAILAKEYLNVKQALIVAPSNVIDTWRGYLSDEVDKDGKQIGYFKEGETPKILVVDSLGALDNETLQDYDYILISHEKLNSKYAEKLKTLDYEMLIVDEVHKLKNIRSGIRATHLLDLARKVEGEDKYLALLSGTPIPNKVEDIAITLKLLYPEEFEHMPNKTLVQRIIHSDAIDLRTKLLPRMQMKKLAESVEMPSLQETIISPELSEIEETIYEMLLEEDEIEPAEKIRILRQFLLNPELLDATPNIESSKITAVGESLRKTFEDKDKVVMFVNGYISQVIKGEKNIIDQLNLPTDIEVKVIHGDISNSQRISLQKELRESKQKILLLVSGQTADVGVDFSAGESVYFYNEPWTRYEQKQELSRVYRPGLSDDLESKIFITKDTIEEGIHLYIQAKEQAIEKLLKGLPRSEIENRLLNESEKQTDPNLEVNPELARYYFSDWDKMAKIFAHIKEIGQENFMQFLADFGKDYASCYLNLGSRSYQANADRVSGTVIDSLVKEAGQSPEELRILDIASGPEMLRKHIPTPYQTKVTSMDVNKEHFRGEGGDRVVGSFQKLPFAEQSVDYANFALALHYTQFIPSRNNYERLEALMELNRVLKVGGKAVLNMIYSIDFKDENKLRISLEKMGLKIRDDYSGEVTVGKNYKSKVFTLEKTEHHSEPLDEMAGIIGRDNLDGLKFVGNKSTVRDTRKIIEEFELGGKQMQIDFNEDDKQVLAEEQEITQQGEHLKAQYGSIQEISKEDIINNDFTRILIKDKYILFKKLKLGRGVVVIK